MTFFEDRRDAGRKLAQMLKKYATQDNVVIVALPRGGIVTGYEVAKELGAPLDIVVPRKISAPNNPELAIGAVTEDGTTILNQKLVEALGVPKSYIKAEATREINEAKRRLRSYRPNMKERGFRNKTLLVVDDGIATGYTMKAALYSLQKYQPASIVIAVPVAPQDTLEALKGLVDEIVCLEIPEFFSAIGMFFHDFRQTSDDEVIALMKASNTQS